MKMVAMIKMLIILSTLLSFATFAEWNDQSDEVTTLQSADEDSPAVAPFPTEENGGLQSSDSLDGDEDDF
jgi:hypothetical protein